MSFNNITPTGMKTRTSFQPSLKDTLWSQPIRDLLAVPLHCTVGYSLRRTHLWVCECVWLEKCVCEREHVCVSKWVERETRANMREMCVVVCIVSLAKNTPTGVIFTPVRKVWIDMITSNSPYQPNPNLSPFFQMITNVNNINNQVIPITIHLCTYCTYVRFYSSHLKNTLENMKLINMRKVFKFF